MNSCDNKPADSLVAGTFLGTDCDGNPVGAGGSIATCRDVQAAKKENNEAIKEAAKNANEALAKEIQDRTAADTTEKQERVNADEQERLARIEADKNLRNETKIKTVKREGDNAIIEMLDGTQYPFSVIDGSRNNGDRPVQFAPSANGDNIEITLADGTVLDMTRQELAEWLAAKDSPMVTDEELRQAVLAGKKEVLDKLNELADSINYDQAKLSYAANGNKTGNLVLENEDGTRYVVNLISGDSGNLLEARPNGLYYGIEAPPNLANIYVDGELGNDDRSPADGGGSIDKPFRTLDRAFEVTPYDKSNTIHIKAVTSKGTPQVYQYSSSMHVSNATRDIRVYGQRKNIEDGIKCLLANQYGVQPHYATEVVRPRIIPTYVVINAYNEEYLYMSQLRVSGSGTINMYGIEIELPKEIAGYPLYSRSFCEGTGTILFKGCVIQDTDNTQTVLYQSQSGSNINLNFTRTQIKNLRSASIGFILIGSGTGSISSYDEFDQAMTGKGGDCNFTLTSIVGNATSQLVKPKGIDGIVRGSNGDPLNLNTNFIV